MVIKTMRWNIKDNNLFSFNTLFIKPHSDFIENIKNFETNKKYEVLYSNPFNQDNENELSFPQFVFDGAFIEFEYSWYNQTKVNISKNELLYLFYHYIFNIKTYTVAHFIYEENRFNSVNFSIINEYVLNSLIEGYDIIKEDVVYKIPTDGLKRLVSKESFKKHCEIWERWKWINRILYSKTRNKKREDIFITPIVFWVENNDNIESLRKVLEKFAPNQWYDKKEAEEVAELSLQKNEVFEFFTTVSKNIANPNYERIKKRLLDEWMSQNISSEELQKQLDVVENFLSNILK